MSCVRHKQQSLSLASIVSRVTQFENNPRPMKTSQHDPKQSNQAHLINSTLSSFRASKIYSPTWTSIRCFFWFPFFFSLPARHRNTLSKAFRKIMQFCTSRGLLMNFLLLWINWHLRKNWTRMIFIEEKKGEKLIFWLFSNSWSLLNLEVRLKVFRVNNFSPLFCSLAFMLFVLIIAEKFQVAQGGFEECFFPLNKFE